MSVAEDTSAHATGRQRDHGCISAAVIAGISCKETLWSFHSGLPRSSLFYNNDSLKRAGVTVPDADPAKCLIWEGLLAKARTAQKGGSGSAFDQSTGITSFSRFMNHAVSGRPSPETVY